jgi:hypothetical protein
MELILINEHLLYCSVIFNTLFGLSTEYWMAIATRLVLGSLNGLLAPIKVLHLPVSTWRHLNPDNKICIHYAGVRCWSLSNWTSSSWALSCNLSSNSVICYSSWCCCIIILLINTRIITNMIFSLKMNTAWGLGLVIGPALGGYLAQVLVCA